MPIWPQNNAIPVIMDLATSLLKALDLLTVLGGSSDGKSIADLAFAMNLPRSTVVRILNTLVEYGLVERRNGLCHATEQFERWAIRDRHFAMRTRYRPVIEAIAAQTGELVLLGVLDGAGIIHIDYVESDHTVRVAPAPDTRHSLRHNALGKLALSRRPDLARRWTRGDKAFADELEEIRRTGVAWNREESVRGMIALATHGFEEAPVEPMIAIAWPSFRFTEKAASDALRFIKKTTGS